VCIAFERLYLALAALGGLCDSGFLVTLDDCRHVARLGLLVIVATIDHQRF
jgi:hypothetical protein